MDPGPQRLRITHVITDINPGGAELALLRLAEATVGTCEHRVIVISDWDPLRPRFEALGVPVTTIGLARRSPNPIRLARLAAAIRRSRPDVVQTWMPAGDLLGGMLARLVTRAPVVWNIRNSELAPDRSHRLTRSVTRTNGRLSWLVPSRIVTVGGRAADVHVALGYDRNRMIVIRNGFDVPATGTDRAAARRALGIEHDALVVSRLGRFHPDKDHHSLLAAWSTVARAHQRAVLLLAGADMDATNNELGRMLDQLLVRPSVRLLGRLDDPTGVYAASDITVSNSLAEGFPNVVGEAMALGTTAIVTDVGDSALLVGDTGHVVPAGDPAALAAAILGACCQTPAQRHTDGERARSRIVERFSMNTMAAAYVDLWSEVARVRD